MPSIPPLPLKRCALISFVGILVVFGTQSLLYTTTFQNLGEEDGFAESGGAICFLGAAIVFFWMFLMLRRRPANSSKELGAWFWYLILSALFVFIAGEEISWGQRIFGWETPDYMAENNVQNETTIHNLEIFNVYTKEHELKPFWQSLLTMNRLFSLFWLSWCLLLPLAIRYVPPVGKLVTWLRIPIPGIIYGCLFFVTYATTKAFVMTNDPEERILAQTDEIKEAFFALLFLLVALDLMRRYRASTPA